MRGLNIILMMILTMSITGCESSSSGLPAYACSFECLASTPVISTNSISSASGGTVVVDIELTGDVTNVSSVSVSLQGIDSASVIATETLLSPTIASNSISVVVPAGTAAGTYYPKVALVIATPSPGQSWYGFDSSISSTRYYYHERTASSEAIMLSPFTIPQFVVN